MKIHVRLLTVLAMLGLVAVPLLNPATSAAAPATAQSESAAAASSWLADQFVDGQYMLGFDGTTPDPTSTIDAAVGVYAGGADAETASTVTNWVAGQAGEYVTDPATAARTAILADLAGEDPADFGGVDLVEALNSELGDIATNPYGLALVIIAMSRLDIDVPQDTVTALLATQEDEGAFGFPDYGIDMDATAIAAQALLTREGDQAASDAADKAVEWLLANQCTETSDLCPTTGAYWGSFSPANTAGLAIGALSAAGEDTTAHVQWLQEFQNDDGGFPASFDAPDSDTYATSQAILGLRAGSLADLTPGTATPADPGQEATTDPTEPAEGDTEDDPDSDDDGGIGLPVIIGVAVAAGVIGGLFAFFNRRRQG
ncbi:MAG: prenyltransferase/squalene oxidase repeat-containing protein [Brooklawnia sp.]|jgi:hypothetical protein